GLMAQPRAPERNRSVPMMHPRSRRGSGKPSPALQRNGSCYERWLRGEPNLGIGIIPAYTPNQLENCGRETIPKLVIWPLDGRELRFTARGDQVRLTIESRL